MSVKSAVRVLEVLELFANRRTPLRAWEIGDALQYPQSSTTMLLKSLISMGYLSYDRIQRTYFPTVRVTSLGDWVMQHVFDNGKLIELIQDVGCACGETTGLAVRNDIYVQYLRVIESRRDGTAEANVKSSVTTAKMYVLSDSVAGLALLSQLPMRAAERICRLINARMTVGAPRINVKDMLDQLARIGSDGYCLKVAGHAPDRVTLAMPLYASRHELPLAIGVCGPAERMQGREQEIAAVIRETAAKYSSHVASVHV